MERPLQYNGFAMTLPRCHGSAMALSWPCNCSVTLDIFFWAPSLDKENYKKHTLTYFCMLKYRKAFWPMFTISSNDLGNWVKVKDIFALRPAPSTHFRGSSCCDSRICWKSYICEVLPGCVKTHSKTTISIHVAIFVCGLGWGWGGGCGGGGGSGEDGDK